MSTRIRVLQRVATDIPVAIHPGGSAQVAIGLGEGARVGIVEAGVVVVEAASFEALAGEEAVEGVEIEGGFALDEVAVGVVEGPAYLFAG